MKYKTKPSKANTRDTFNAWKLATMGGKLSRVSVSKYRKAYAAAFRLRWLNEYADKVAEFDNDSERYTEEKSEKMNNKLLKQAEAVAQMLRPLGLEFFNCSHLYGVAVIGANNQIYLRF